MDNNARRPPRGMRYTFAPGEPVRVVLEPWNESFTLKGTEYDGYERVVRVWGRKRLELLLNVLPYAQRVTVGVLGRGMPHFYVCHCGDYAFTLVLSGWTRGAWSGGMAFDLLAPPSKADPEAVATVYNHLVQYLSASRSHTAEHTGLGFDEVEAALLRLCKAGRAIYDPVSHRYRSRELFAEPLDVDALFAPDPRVAEAEGLVESGAVRVDRVFPSDTRKNEIKALAEVAADGTTYDVLVAVDRDGRIRFAQCQCAFFQDNILSRGPCAHILAARFAAEDRLQEVEKSLIMEGR
jgi:predicted nucleic acid-binding Zn finger protein